MPEEDSFKLLFNGFSLNGWQHAPFFFNRVSSSSSSSSNRKKTDWLDRHHLLTFKSTLLVCFETRNELVDLESDETTKH